MNEVIYILINLAGFAGLFIFTSIGYRVYCLVSQRYWDTGKYGTYDLPWWVEYGIMVSFAFLGGGVWIALGLTVLKLQ